MTTKKQLNRFIGYLSSKQKLKTKKNMNRDLEKYNHRLFLYANKNQYDIKG